MPLLPQPDQCLAGVARATPWAAVPVDVYDSWRHVDYQTTRGLVNLLLTCIMCTAGQRLPGRSSGQKKRTFRLYDARPSNGTGCRATHTDERARGSVPTAFISWLSTGLAAPTFADVTNECWGLVTVSRQCKPFQTLQHDVRTRRVLNGLNG
jgi:hypothetical protein